MGENMFLPEDFSEIISDFLETYRRVNEVFNKIDWTAISEYYRKLPEAVQSSAEKWSEYGWDPFLPGYSVIDIIRLKNPNSQDEADKIMMEKLDHNGLQELFSILEQKVISHSHCIYSFDEAVKSYDNEIYSGCALLLFALIDSCFIVGQPFPKKKSDRDRSERKLSLSAVGKAIDNDKSKWIVSAYATKKIIEKCFMRGEDFKESNEIGINRNFLAHGMNRHIPTQKDCLQLFVLLYNIYVLFDTGMFHWELSTEL